MKKFVVFFLALILFLPSLGLAKIGVGVGTGKIIMDEELREGVGYLLPPLTVFNTGDEVTTYEVAVTHRETQPELKPNPDWFSFSPTEFTLDPGKGQVVEITMNLPLKVEPGNYFSFIEGHPKKIVKSDGNTSIGIAAAAKLYFTVEPSSIIQAVYYKIIFLFTNYAPWTYIVLILIVVAILYKLMRKKFKFKISIDRKK